MSQVNRRKYAMANLQRVSAAQWTMLLDYMDSHRTLANVATNMGAACNSNVKTQWEHLAQRLNAGTTFPRTGEQWRRYWCNRRSAVRRKAEKRHLEDGTAPTQLDSDECRMLEIFGASDTAIGVASKPSKKLRIKNSSNISLQKPESKHSPSQTCESVDDARTDHSVNQTYPPCIAPKPLLPTPLPRSLSSPLSKSLSEADFPVSKSLGSYPNSECVECNEDVKVDENLKAETTESIFNIAGTFGADGSHDSSLKEHEFEAGILRVSCEGRIMNLENVPHAEQGIITAMLSLRQTIENCCSRVTRKQFSVTFRGSNGDESEYVFMSSSKNRRSNQPHSDVRCGLCGHIVVGFRYKCVVCENYNLCSACESLGAHSHHVVVRIARPVKLKRARELLDRWCDAIKAAGFAAFDNPDGLARERENSELDSTIKELDAALNIVSPAPHLELTPSSRDTKSYNERSHAKIRKTPSYLDVQNIEIDVIINRTHLNDELNNLKIQERSKVNAGDVAMENVEVKIEQDEGGAQYCGFGVSEPTVAIQSLVKEEHDPDPLCFDRDLSTAEQSEARSKVTSTPKYMKIIPKRLAKTVTSKSNKINSNIKMHKETLAKLCSKEKDCISSNDRATECRKNRIPVNVRSKHEETSNEEKFAKKSINCSKSIVKNYTCKYPNDDELVLPLFRDEEFSF